MPKQKIFAGNLQSRGVRAHMLGLALTLFLLSACGGPSQGATPTPLPAGERIEQPTPNFIAPTATPTAEAASTDGPNPLQAILATQIAQRAQEATVVATSTPMPTATAIPAPRQNPGPGVSIDSTLTNPTSMGIVGGGTAFFASPGGAVLQNLPAGATLTITGRSGDGGWYAAYLEDGRAGWVSVGAVRIFGDPGQLVVVNESISPSIVATLIAEANRPVTPIPTTAPATRVPTAPSAVTPIAPSQPAQDQPPPTAESPSGPSAIVIVDGVNVRAGPGTEFDIVGSLVRDASMLLVGRNEAGDWLQIEIPDGRGWVFAQLVQASVEVETLPVTP